MVGYREDALSLTLPARWQRIDTQRLLAQIQDSPSAQSLPRRAGEYASSRIRDGVGRLLDVHERCDLVFTAMRVRSMDSAVDILTLVLPDPPDKMCVGGKSLNAPDRGEVMRPVELANGPAIAHWSVPTTNADSEAAFFESHAQIVLRIPPSNLGAIVTLLSSAPGSGRLLLRDAEEIAGSMQLPSAVA